MANNNCGEPTCTADATSPCTPEVDLRCIPSTNVEPPDWTPLPDQLPMAVFTTNNNGVLTHTMYYHTCDYGWITL